MTARTVTDTEAIKDKLLSLFNIRADEAPTDEIRHRIESGAKIGGTNLYVLIAAIIIASIGLNMNSTAVIIGAMLISPLMGSIIGIGYGLGTKQSNFTRNCLEGLLWQLGIALVTSTVYFLLSPITVPSEEILARTSPTVWDVLIAFFGGAAGIIGQTRKEKSNNIIPGVAIATALMPPVCTAGFGLANGKFTIMLGALDLFLVNCLCIFATTFLFTKILKLDDTPDDMPKSRKLVLRIAILVVLVFLPTGYYAFNYVTHLQNETSISGFIDEQFVFEDTQVIKYSYNDDNKILTVTLVGNEVTEEELEEIRDSLTSYGLGEITLKVTQTSSDKYISEEEIDDIIDKKLKNLNEELDAVIKENKRLSEEIGSLSEENASLSEQLSEVAAETTTEVTTEADTATTE